MSIKVWPGVPYPLGATWTGHGVNFAVFSENATGVDVCLFDRADSESETVRVRLTEYTDQVWHAFLPEIRPGQYYGFRVYGPYAPEKGLRFNASKLLLDPYSKAISGDIDWGKEMYGYEMDGSGDGHRDYHDDAWGMPKSIVIDPAFDWEGDKLPRTPLHKSIIYEAHVKGFSQLNPDVPDPLRGTYAGLASEVSIKYLTDLGITAIELLPVHQHAEDQHLVEKGLKNYWGYNTLSYFAPHHAYAASAPGSEAVREFKQMVKNLHAAGIEVIIDVVYNHTAEGNHLGPTLCFKGVDNPTYYRLMPDDPRYYMDFTGCGNSLNVLHPTVLRMIVDSLRYWVTEMHVDGFRFDLAATLVRGENDINKYSSFLAIIHQDPVLSQVKLIAEPWDIGMGGYLVGSFPVLWTEWNGRYRDTVRKYWKGDDAQVGELANRLSGSSDLYQTSGKRPYASINFITSHDGFSLNDLVSYNDKHNEANGENNNDGDNSNHSWNCGVEGPTDDEAVISLRHRQRRNFLATLLLSQGVPMLLGGDEYGRTQYGNNNAYCQDDKISWIGWQRDKPAQQLLSYTQGLDQAAQGSPGVPASEVLPGPQDSRAGGQGHHVVQPRRHGDERPGVGRGLRALPGDAPERQDHRRARRAGRAHRGRHVPGVVQRVPRSPALHPARADRRALGPVARHRGRPRVRRAGAELSGGTGAQAGGSLVVSVAAGGGGGEFGDDEVGPPEAGRSKNQEPRFKEDPRIKIQKEEAGRVSRRNRETTSVPVCCFVFVA